MVEMDRRAWHESHLLTRERIMGQRRKLKALAGMCEFHLSYFLEVVMKQRYNSWDIRTILIDCLKRYQVQVRLSQGKQCRIL